MNNERRPPMRPRDDRDQRQRGPRRPGPGGHAGQSSPSGYGQGERRFGGGGGQHGPRRGPGGGPGMGGRPRLGGKGGPRRPGGGGRPGAHRHGGGARRREQAEGFESDEILSGPIEANYLRELVSARTPIEVKLRNGQTHSGTIEYWDQRFIRLTPPSGPNLFIYKQDIKYLLEVG